jgi:plastocyanin
MIGLVNGKLMKQSSPFMKTGFPMRIGVAVAVVVLAVIPVRFGKAATQPSAAQPRASGSIEGVVTYQPDRKRRWRYARYYVKNRRKGFLAEAVIAIDSGKLDGDKLNGGSKSPASRLHVIDQKDYRFVPETIAIRAGDRVKFTNADPVVHNVFSSSPAHRFDVNLRKGSENVQRFGRAGGIEKPVRLQCVFHSTMQSWIFVFEHPFYQVTGENGRFRLQNVPPGRYRLVMTHPAGELKFVKQIEVTAGKTTRLDIRVSPDNKVESKKQ